MNILHKITSIVYKSGRKVKQCLWQPVYSGFMGMCFSDCGKNFQSEGGLAVVGGEFISVGRDCVFHQEVELYAFRQIRNQTFEPKIFIGNQCNLGRNNKITATNSIEFGDGVLTGGYVTITDNNHGKFSAEELAVAPDDRPIYSKGGIVIGKNVWIGEKATILGNVHIGEGAIVAANAVVTKDVPANSIVAGVPARVVRSL